MRRAADERSRRARLRALGIVLAAAIIGGAIGLLHDGPEERAARERVEASPAGVAPEPGVGTEPAEVAGEGATGSPRPTGSEIAAGGRVIDHRTGRGVPGAAVTVAGSRDPRVPTLGHARTDSAGVFICRVEERDLYEISVRADGYAPVRFSIADGLTPAGVPFEIGDLELEIAPESVIRVLPDLPGLPPEESVVVELQLRQSRTPAELGEPLVVRQSERLFEGGGRIGSLAMGQYLLSFRTSSQRLGTREVELGMGEERVVEFSIGPPVPIRGTVTRNGRPVAGGKLVIWGRDQASHTAAVVDERGGYRVSLPAAGSYAFAFTPSRHSQGDGAGGSRELAIEGPGIVDLDYRTVRLTGRVTGAEGEPLAGLAGTLFGPQALSFVTDATGEFAFDDVPLGVYRWLFAAPPAGCFGPAEEFAVEGDTEAHYAFAAAVPLEIQLVGEPTDIGEVGAPQVGLLGAGGEVAPLRPTGEPARWWWPAEGGLGVVQKRGSAPWFFELPPSERPPRQLVDLSPGGELTVTLFGEDGRSLDGHGFRIEPIDAPDLPVEWRERRTGPRGSAVLALPPGRYRVSAELAGSEASREIRIVEHASTEARLP